MKAVYLDWAATSALRPDTVPDAVATYLRECGGIPGAGGHRIADVAAQTTARGRREILEFFGLPGPTARLAFTANATHALNTALRGFLRPGDRAVVTAFDHAAVFRPLAALARERNIEVVVLPGSPDGTLDLSRADEALAGAALLTTTVASNVIGVRLPLEELTRRAQAAGARVLVDASQGAGRMPLDFGALGVDMVAFTGHKGLLGPSGIGGLWVAEGLVLDPLLFGGSGGGCLTHDMPETMPERLEAGTVNVPGVAGLLAGLEHVRTTGVEAIHDHERRMKNRLREGMSLIDGVTLVSPPAEKGVGIVTCTLRDLPSSAAADRLDGEWGVMCRPGIHCAPETHRVLGTLDEGALRLSVGWATTEDDVDHAVTAIQSLMTDRTRTPPIPDATR